MATTILLDHDLEIPSIGSLAEFRAWAASSAFPERGRIDYLGGAIEVDMSPESLYSHGALKIALIYALEGRIRRTGAGRLFSDRTRVSNADADLSTEPDLVFVSHESLRDGRVGRVPKAAGRGADFIELDGAPDLIVEIVSDRSVAKDTRRLPAAYWLAGIREYWLADARGERLVFHIHRRGESGFEPTPADADGFQPSAVFGCDFRLVRRAAEDGWTYDLEIGTRE